MRILVFGRSGQLADALVRAADPSIVIEAAGRPGTDLADRASLHSAIARFRPDVVINAAAYTAVDKAEGEPAAAFAIIFFMSAVASVMRASLPTTRFTSPIR